VNSEDAIPYMPLSSWGYTRHGITYYIPAIEAADTKIRESFTHDFYSYTGADFVRFSKGIKDLSFFEERLFSLAHSTLECYTKYHYRTIVNSTLYDYFNVLANYLSSENNIADLSFPILIEYSVGDFYSFASFFSNNKKAITYGHTPETYLSWVNVMSESDYLRGLSSVPASITVTAAPTASSVLVNGNTVTFEAYTIDGNNYFKLRDLAKVLSGTPKQFEVGWDGTNNVITLTTGKPYTAIGEELTQSGTTTAVTATLSNSRVLLNGTEKAFSVYMIGSNNYFKLRDVAAAIDFGVTWSGNTIGIDTSTGYTA
jgi:hypothetical protein